MVVSSFKGPGIHEPALVAKAALHWPGPTRDLRATFCKAEQNIDGGA